MQRGMMSGRVPKRVELEIRDGGRRPENQELDHWVLQQLFVSPCLARTALLLARFACATSTVAALAAVLSINVEVRRNDVGGVRGC